jgi:DNA (cytosine-5)-methyltransferase 1
MSSNELLKTDGVPILSFFTGAGFLDLGFMQNNFNVAWHNEYHQPFVDAFEYGISSLGYNDESVRIQNTESIIDIGPNAIIQDAFPTGQIPSEFGVIGGPPCPDFSVGGKNKGQLGVNGKLSEVYVNRIIELHPTFFVFENVPGLLRTAKHRAFLLGLLRKLSELYSVDLKLLNALDFGVPQDRERVFIVGFNKKWLKRNYNKATIQSIEASSSYIPMLGKLSVNKFFSKMNHWFPWPEDPEFKGAKSRFTWPKDLVPLGNTPEIPDCPNSLMVGTYICDPRRDKLSNSSESFVPKSAKFTQILEGDVSRKSFKRLHRYRYSPAAAYGNNEVHLHPTEPRRLTVREALMIQSVPDEYVLPPDMTLTNKFKTIGNGVPVKLAHAVASAISAFMKGANNETL